MGFVVDLFGWLLIEGFILFVCYATGYLILKIITFGQYKDEFKSFSSFKQHRAIKVNYVSLLGALFYVALIVLMVHLSN